MKKFVMGVIVGVSITVAGSVYADEGLQKIEAYLRPTLPVTLDGTPLVMESSPVMVDGSTYLKLRDVAAATGLDVKWNDATQTVELSSEGVEKVEVNPTTTQSNSSTTEESSDVKRYREVSGEITKLLNEKLELENKVNVIKTTHATMDQNVDDLNQQIFEKQKKIDSLAQEKSDLESRIIQK